MSLGEDSGEVVEWYRVVGVVREGAWCGARWQMSEDLYTAWLGVAEGERPPHHYALLGVPLFCDDAKAIDRAARSQLQKLDRYKIHPDRQKRDACARMMNEVAKARVTLVDLRRKEAYDCALAERLGKPRPERAVRIVDAAPARISLPSVARSVEETRSVHEGVAAEAEEAEARQEEFVTWLFAQFDQFGLSADDDLVYGPAAEEFGIPREQAPAVIAEARLECEARERQLHTRTRWIAGVGVSMLAAIIFVGIWMTISANAPEAEVPVENEVAGEGSRSPSYRSIVGGPYLVLDLGGGVAMELVLIPAGEFMMGSEKGLRCEQPVHRVRIGTPFHMGRYEVTQEQWQAVMYESPSEFKGPKLPVENVSWNDCQSFLEKLSQKVRGRTFFLPSEAQWEYACRAGTTTAYSFGDSGDELDQHAWYGDNSNGRTHAVGWKKHNAWGLYDMHGNVWEWCQDMWHKTYRGAPRDGNAWMSGGNRNSGVLRGGSWRYGATYCRSADRVMRTRDNAYGPTIGFRVAAGAE